MSLKDNIHTFRCQPADVSLSVSQSLSLSDG